MRKKLSTLLLLLVTLTATAQPSRVIESLTIESKILGMDKHVAIYLPEGYDRSDRAYPVLYLLHGSGDNHTGWIQFGRVQQIADKAYRNETATQMIIVMPDAMEPDGDLSKRGYFNHISGTHNYETYFFEELIPYVEQHYRTRPEKRFRAIAGLSMGGGGTLVYALHHPELFAAACPLSAAVHDMSGELPERMIAKGNYPKSTSNEWIAQYDILGMAAEKPEAELKSVRWYIDCGDGDFLSEGNAMLQLELIRRKIPHEFRVRDGAHTWTYWRTALPEVLRFVSESFQQP